jgi:hypothetical protein
MQPVTGLLYYYRRGLKLPPNESINNKERCAVRARKAFLRKSVSPLRGLLRSGFEVIAARKEGPAIQYCEKFTAIAVSKGFITAQQAEAALSVQSSEDRSNKRHRLVGNILFEKGWITPQQIDLVLNELFQKAS